MLTWVWLSLSYPDSDIFLAVVMYEPLQYMEYFGYHLKALYFLGKRERKQKHKSVIFKRPYNKEAWVLGYKYFFQWVIKFL